MSAALTAHRSVADVFDHVWENRSALQSREAHAMMLLALARENPDLACLTVDMDYEASFTGALARQHVNLGIAEQNMISVAAGMTVAARPVFATGMSPFVSARAYEQIKVDVAGANLPVKIVGTHGGLASGHYGPTHHSTEDIGALRLLPNMTVVVPGDAWEAVQATVAVAEDPGPAYLRLGRQATPALYEERTDFVLGRARVLREPGRVVFIATGPHPNLVAAQAARELAEQGVSAGHLNMHTVKPLDREAVVDACARAEAVVTIEDHRAVGGLGGAVCEVVAEIGGPPVRRIGVPDVHYDLVGGEQYLLHHAGVNAANAVAQALKALA
ncbi:transketolase C-terminal domain-containing protein [Streptomyces sp. HNM0663]|uniref:Transketolase C-terminal domain-containing protein n=1 Tax=Streptomyces chengmaiensis TaxID=3040919 RepID=A0ABT6HHS7_9ACTN|nr:transketolase C-terminal domain-containing protein [Streptomyces chengmaiensis]MDH2388145.1 transketolase C-terminal domain-containing protein [Streptomyces chengmaiensis]